jgi:hypothetical protein
MDMALAPMPERVLPKLEIAFLTSEVPVPALRSTSIMLFAIRFAATDEMARPPMALVNALASAAMAQRDGSCFVSASAMIELVSTSV